MKDENDKLERGNGGAVRSVRIDDERWAELRACADINGRTVSCELVTALDVHMKKILKRSRR